MIHSARLIVTPVANIVFCCFVFLDLKSGDGRGRTDNMCENNDLYRPWLWVGRVDQKGTFKYHMEEETETSVQSTSDSVEKQENNEAMDKQDIKEESEINIENDEAATLDKNLETKVDRLLPKMRAYFNNCNTGWGNIFWKVS